MVRGNQRKKDSFCALTTAASLSCQGAAVVPGQGEPRSLQEGSPPHTPLLMSSILQISLGQGIN